MGDPGEERFVLLAEGIEEVVWLYCFHSGYFNRATTSSLRCVSGPTGAALR